MTPKTLLVGPYMCEVDPPLAPDARAEDQAFQTLVQNAPEHRYPLLYSWVMQGIPAVVDNPVFTSIMAQPHNATAAEMEAQSFTRKRRTP